MLYVIVMHSSANHDNPSAPRFGALIDLSKPFPETFCFPPNATEIKFEIFEEEQEEAERCDTKERTHAEDFVESRCMHYLGLMLSEIPGHVKKVDLSQQDFVQWQDAFVDALQKLPPLTSLNLSVNGIGFLAPDSMKKFAQCVNAEELCLSGNYLFQAGMSTTPSTSLFFFKEADVSMTRTATLFRHLKCTSLDLSNNDFSMFIPEQQNEIVRLAAEGRKYIDLSNVGLKGLKEGDFHALLGILNPETVIRIKEMRIDGVPVSSLNTTRERLALHL